MDRLLVDLDENGRVSVFTWMDGELPSTATEPAALTWPLAASESDAINDAASQDDYLTHGRIEPDRGRVIHSAPGGYDLWAWRSSDRVGTGQPRQGVPALG